ncbi:hypothetical protein SBADM41S_04620 [Streptomyces badius]
MKTRRQNGRSGTRLQRAATGFAYSVGTGCCQYGEVRGRNGARQAAPSAVRSRMLSRTGKSGSMFGSSIVPGRVTASTTTDGQTSRSEARLPTLPTTARSTQSSWCCQAVGETATTTHPVTATARSTCPSAAYRTARRSPMTTTAAASTRNRAISTGPSRPSRSSAPCRDWLARLSGRSPSPEPARWCTQYVHESFGAAAQATAVARAKAAPALTDACRLPVSQSRAAKSSSTGWKAAATPTRTPAARCSRTTNQASSTSRTGRMLVWPRCRALRTGSDSMNRQIATGAASRAVRRPTGPGNALAATRPRATTSSRDPNVQATPRVCWAVAVSGFRTSPAKGVPVNRPLSYNEPVTCRTPLSPIQVSRSRSRSPGGCRSTTATCRTASAATTSQSRALVSPVLAPVSAAASPRTL